MITIITVCLVVTVVFVLIWTSSNSNENEVERLKQEYESALSGFDKKAALKAGRLYYAAGRKDKAPTIYDELAIANDLNTMPQKLDASDPENNIDINEAISKPPTSTVINY